MREVGPARTGEELLDLPGEELAVRPRHMIGDRELDVLRAGNVLGEIAAVPDADEAVVACVQDQGRHPHLCQHRPHVELDRRRDQRAGRRGARAAPAGIDPPGPEAVPLGEARRHQVEIGPRRVVTGPSRVLQPFDEMDRHADRIVVAARQPGERVDQHERVHAFRVTRGGKDRPRTGVRDTQERRGFRSRGIEHGHEASPTNGSESPTPRGSKRISRLNDAMRST